MSPFEVVNGYKPRKPLNLLPMSIHARVSESAESFGRRIQDLHIEITKQIQESNAQYKLQVDLHRRHNEFNVGDYVMIQIRPEQFSSGTNQKLHACSARPFKVLQRVGPNAYVLDLPHDFGISSTFNIEDLVAYHKPLPIPNDPFELPLNSPPDDRIETSISFTFTSVQKDNINAILDEQVVFNRNSEVQRFLVRWVGRPDSLEILSNDLFELPLGSLEILCSRLIQIFWSTIKVGQCYTRRGRVSPTPGELAGTPYPYRKLHRYMDGEDVGWPSLSRFGWETKPI